MNVVAVVKRQRRLLAVGVTLGLLGAVSTLAQPALVGVLIARVSAGEPVQVPATLLAVLFALDAALAALQAYLLGRAGENIVLDLRMTLVGRLLHARMRAFTQLEHGDVFTRTVADTSVARLALSSSIATLVTSAFITLGCVVIMAIIDLQLLLVTVVSLGAASAVALTLARAIRKAAVTNRTHTSAFGSALLRVLSGLTTVKASRAEDREAQRLQELGEAARDSGIRVTKLSALMKPAMNVGTQVSLALVIALGMARTATGDLPIAELTAFLMYLFYLVSPLVLLFMALGEFQQGRAAVDRVTQLADVEQETLEGSPGPRAARVPDAAAVEFEGVTFTYPGGSAPALTDVSFRLPRTGVTSLLGPSGAGKTTVFQLIERFYDREQGTVRVAGVDAAEVGLRTLRADLALVEQDAPLLRGTVRENLTYAAPDATDEQLEDAIRAANLEHVIDHLSEGVDTELGEGGSGLSGGQRQRLAIARALLSGPTVLLLDEATANLDAEAERALCDTIRTVGQRCQVVVITHRPSTAAVADRLIVLDEGRVRADGPARELIDTDPDVRHLIDGQLVGG